jgi:hypothetical protein
VSTSGDLRATIKQRIDIFDSSLALQKFLYQFNPIRVVGWSGKNRSDGLTIFVTRRIVQSQRPLCAANVCIRTRFELHLWALKITIARGTDKVF